jgi:hypothetical protein
MKTNKKYPKFCFYCVIAALAALLAVLPVSATYLNFPIFQGKSVGKSSQTHSSGKKNRKKEGKSKSKMNQSKLTSVPPGIWGATGIGLVIGNNGGEIEYDCADGEIEQKLTVDKNGNFNVNGVHIPSHPGPIRLDSPPERKPARYQGKISGKTMTLAVTLTENNKKIGEYVLERDKFPRIHRCL